MASKIIPGQFSLSRAVNIAARWEKHPTAGFCPLKTPIRHWANKMFNNVLLLTGGWLNKTAVITLQKQLVVYFRWGYNAFSMLFQSVEMLVKWLYKISILLYIKINQKNFTYYTSSKSINLYLYLYQLCSHLRYSRCLIFCLIQTLCYNHHAQRETSAEKPLMSTLWEDS